MLSLAAAPFDQFQPADVFVLLVLTGTFAVALVAIVVWGTVKMVKSSNLEKSRREIAAYVAEGSMSPEDGERLLHPGVGPVDIEKSRRELANCVAEGSMTPEDAERLLNAGGITPKRPAFRGVQIGLIAGKRAPRPPQSS